MTELGQQIDDLIVRFKVTHERVHPPRWQSVDVSRRPDAEMLELTHVILQGPMESKNLEDYRQSIKPNLPWADDHFEQERVSGYPINPGSTWKYWPYGHAAERALEGGMFNHTYAERFWPKQAGLTEHEPNHRGIRHDYGDLGGVVRLLVLEPATRQAYLPVWFPEDTGDSHFGRKPCSLGYHVLLRKGRLDMDYHIRSCDIKRHLRDDVYLGIRLCLWIIEECAKKDKLWLRVKPGQFTMLIGSLHCFIGDIDQIV